MLISGIVTLVNFVLATLVGVRLVLRMRQPESGAESWLAGYFLGGALVGNLASVIAYASLGEQGVPLSKQLAALILGVGAVGHLGAGTSLFLFTWRTFRPGEGWAAACTWLGVGLLAVATVGKLAWELEVQVLPGASYWVERVVYATAFVWIAIESLRYSGALVRRAAIGLGDPVLANRFFLWGLWAVAGTVLTLSELLARGAYLLRGGSTEVLDIQAAMPIVVVTVGLTSLLGAVSAVTVWLTFYPTQRYLGWLEQRQPTT